jgi:hypothetical protein
VEIEPRGAMSKRSLGKTVLVIAATFTLGSSWISCSAQTQVWVGPDGKQIPEPEPETYESITSKPWVHKSLSCYIFLKDIGHEDDGISASGQAGEDISRFRTNYRALYKRLTGLDDDDVNLMLTIALDGYHALEANEMEGNTEIEAIRHRYSTEQLLKMPVSPKLQKLNDERWQIPIDTLEKLKQALSESSYAKVEKFVRSYEPQTQTTGIRKVPVTNDPSEP